MTTKKKKIIIIDALALIFRSYYALPPLKTRDGMVVNAVYGFFNTLFSVIKEYKPDYLCVAFDTPKPTFRKEMFEEYKAQREAPPEDFSPQIPVIMEILEMLKINTYIQEGFEADDIIGSICAQKSIDNSQVNSYILTGDLDTLQLVDDNTYVITFKRGISETMLYDEQAVKLRYDGVGPKQLIDMKALKGDASDNIPGVKGIGEKGAITLIKEFGTLENIYKNIDSEKISKSLREKLNNDKKMAELSKKLVTIVTDMKIDFKLEENILKPYDKQALIEKLQSLEFKSLTTKIPDFSNGEEVVLQAHDAKKESNFDYTLVDDEKKFNSFVSELKKQKSFAFDTETTSQDSFSAELLGISFSWKENEAHYLPITTKSGDGLFEDIEIKQEWLEELKPIFANDKVNKIGHNIKYDIEVLEQAGLKTNCIHFDTMIAAYLLAAGERTYSLKDLAMREFGHAMQTYEELTNKNSVQLINVPIEKVSHYSCEDANFTWRLFQKLEKELIEKDLDKLMNEIEMPLVRVLSIMEKNGVLIDPKYLNKLSSEVGNDLYKLEKEIHKLAGEDFNIASPNQLQEILFTKLGISNLKIARTKTGYSTGAAELEKLKDVHPIINLIGEYRELAKLQSTYLETLPNQINPRSGRLHTSFNQTIAATGRLSSTDPNLQNIPVRTELGKKVRNAFIAPTGSVILSADYSQIELRLVAHLSQDKNLLKIFKEGKDVHASTAATIHNIPLDQVTKEIRSTAKEVNFGIIYGLGPVGLAQRTGMSRTEAKEFIDKYFEKFPGIKQYIEDSIAIAKERGYAQTFFGRKRYLPEIMSQNSLARSGAERIAVNMPLQGLSADIIKIAMIKVQERLEKECSECKMILQVHDQLLFEVTEDKVAKVSKLVKETMEDFKQFTVPITVDLSIGPSWGELEDFKSP